MDSEPRYLKPLVTIAICLIVLWGIYQVVSGFVAVQNTGILTVNASKPDAVISISQANGGAVIIGTGTARVRLYPGTYQLVAMDAGSRTAVITKISKQHSSHVSLDLNKTSIIRSAASINFQNMSALINNGLTTTQVGQLEQYFFRFKPSTNRVAVDASSVRAGTHNLETSTFTLYCDVSIDSKAYKATLTYADSNNIRMYLYNSSDNSLVFDSNTLPEQPDRR